MDAFLEFLVFTTGFVYVITHDWLMWWLCLGLSLKVCLLLSFTCCIWCYFSFFV